MSCEYANCIGKSDNYIYDLMWKEIMIFRSKVNKKRKLKSILKLVNLVYYFSGFPII